MTDLLFREVKDWDQALQVMRLRNEVRDFMFDQSEVTEERQREWLSTNPMAWLVQRDLKTVGFFSVRPLPRIPSERGLWITLVVDHKFRGQGIGKEIYRQSPVVVKQQLRAKMWHWNRASVMAAHAAMWRVDTNMPSGEVVYYISPVPPRVL